MCALLQGGRECVPSYEEVGKSKECVPCCEEATVFRENVNEPVC